MNLKSPQCRRLCTGGLASLLAMSLAACSSSSDSLPEGRSRLVAQLTASDSTSSSNTALKVKERDTKEVVVHLSRVTAHGDSSGWVTLTETPFTVDLLKLDQKAAELGVANLPAGKVTQLRLYVDSAADNHVVLDDNTHVPLKVPSGSQSGIKVKGPFDLSSCEETTLTLDFDVEHSVKVHSTGNGSGGEYILRPVIRLAKLCDAGGPGSACKTTADCTSGSCGEEGQCESSTGQPTGGSCESALQCNSGDCVDGKCEVGGQGAPCQFYTDCDNGLSCNEGYCAPAIN
jgi:hypothetical protein